MINGMIVVYAAYDIGAWSRDEFAEFLLPLVERARALPGCVVFDYLVDPSEPQRATVFETWQDADAFERWTVSSEHDELMRLPQLSRGGMSGLRVHLWRDAEGHSVIG